MRNVFYLCNVFHLEQRSKIQKMGENKERFYN